MAIMNLMMSPETSVDHLKYACTDHHTVKPIHLDSSCPLYPSSFPPVEAGLKVDSGSKGVHPNKHLGEEKAEENIPVHQPYILKVTQSADSAFSESKILRKKGRKSRRLDFATKGRIHKNHKNLVSIWHFC